MSWMRLHGWGVVCGLTVCGLLSTNLMAEDVLPTTEVKADTQPTSTSVAVAPAADARPAISEERLVKLLGSEEAQPAPAAPPAAATDATVPAPPPAPAPTVPETKTTAPVATPPPVVTPAPVQPVTVAAPAGAAPAAKSTATPPLQIVAVTPISTTCWEPDAEYKAKMAMLQTKNSSDQQDQIRRLIARLASPGWAEASEDLIKIGRPAVPHLITALAVPADPAEPYKASAFNLQGPTRYTRQRPLAETAFDVLNNLIRNHSTYAGAVPARDQAEWQKFWAEQGGSIKLGFEK